jgi:hypothetical protein
MHLKGLLLPLRALQRQQWVSVWASVQGASAPCHCELDCSLRAGACLFWLGLASEGGSCAAAPAVATAMSADAGGQPASYHGESRRSLRFVALGAAMHVAGDPSCRSTCRSDSSRCPCRKRPAPCHGQSGCSLRFSNNGQIMHLQSIFPACALRASSG